MDLKVLLPDLLHQLSDFLVILLLILVSLHEGQIIVRAGLDTVIFYLHIEIDGTQASLVLKAHLKNLGLFTLEIDHLRFRRSDGLEELSA